MATWADIQRGIFAGESGGDYGALFNYQNRPDGRFSNVDLTQMTVDEALQFSDPSGPYAQYVKGQVGRVATPMGAYQVVGTTLRAAKQGLGLAGNERMTPELQDRIGRWIYETQGTGAWEGYKGPRVSTKEGSPMDQMQQPQQPMGLMDRLRDPRTRLALSALSRSSAGQRLGQIAAADLDRKQALEDEQRKLGLQTEQRNRTAEWLRSQPNGEMFAAAIEAGMPANQVYEAYRASLTGDYVVVGKTLVDRKTGKVVFQAPQTATMTRFNPATGQYETVSGIDPSQLKLTEGQGKATLFAGRMQAANAILERYEDQGTDIGQAILGSIPFGKLGQSPEYKLYRQAKEDFINAILRQESGAAIGKDEFDRADEQYFPQPNDPPAVIDQKRRNRERAVELLKLSAGEAAPLIDQQLNLMADQIKSGGAVAPLPAQDGSASSKGNTLE